MSRSPVFLSKNVTTSLRFPCFGFVYFRNSSFGFSIKFFCTPPLRPSTDHLVTPWSPTPSLPPPTPRRRPYPPPRSNLLARLRQHTRPLPPSRRRARVWIRGPRRSSPGPTSVPRRTFLTKFCQRKFIASGDGRRTRRGSRLSSGSEKRSEVPGPRVSSSVTNRTPHKTCLSLSPPPQRLT